MKQVFAKPASLKDIQTHFCPGCHHGSIHRLVAEAMDSLGIAEQTIGCASVGCSVFLYGYFNVDVVESPHGRAPAVATGVKRARPDRIVFTYQGDGDLAAIGTSEIIHAANRGEMITVIFVNNTTYGMTGGQMAPPPCRVRKPPLLPMVVMWLMMAGLSGWQNCSPILTGWLTRPGLLSITPKMCYRPKRQLRPPSSIRWRRRVLPSLRLWLPVPQTGA